MCIRDRNKDLPELERKQWLDDMVKRLDIGQSPQEREWWWFLCKAYERYDALLASLHTMLVVQQKTEESERQREKQAKAEQRRQKRKQREKQREKHENYALRHTMSVMQRLNGLGLAHRSKDVSKNF